MSADEFRKQPINPLDKSSQDMWNDFVKEINDINRLNNNQNQLTNSTVN